MNRFFNAKRLALFFTLVIMSLLVAACAGDAGADGRDGAAGAAGAVGAAGPQGYAGLNGPKGAAGAAGADGAAGANGADGKAGARGPAGPAGAFGADGESTTAGVTVSSNSVSAGTASVSVWLTGFGATEKITVTVTAPDGTTFTDSTDAVNGLATVSLATSAYTAGLHGVAAEGDAGSKASTALNIK